MSRESCKIKANVLKRKVYVKQRNVNVMERQKLRKTCNLSVVAQRAKTMQT